MNAETLVSRVMVPKRRFRCLGQENGALMISAHIEENSRALSDFLYPVRIREDASQQSRRHPSEESSHQGTLLWGGGGSQAAEP